MAAYPGVVAALLLTIVTGWSLAWIFTFVGIIGKSAQAVQGMSMMIMFPLTFLSNAFVPADTLPEWLQTFVNINPVSHVVTAVRDLANTGQSPPRSAGHCFACAAVGRDLRAALGARLPQGDVARDVIRSGRHSDQNV